MGLIDLVFGKHRQTHENDNFFSTLTAYHPAFKNWGGQLYESDIVRSVLNMRAQHMSKLTVDMQGSALPKLHTLLKAQPNPWQTWSQFLYRLSTIYDMQNNAFIVPVIGADGTEIGIYPVLPTNCDIVEVDGTLYLRYRFNNGLTAAAEMSECGHMVKHQYLDDFFGESNAALNPTMELIHLQNQGIKQGIKNSASYRFFAKMSNFSKPDDLAKQRKRFSAENLQGEGGGLLLFPNIYSDITQINNTPYVVDSKQMELIQRNVFNFFGMNEQVLQCKAVGDKLDAYFDGSIEPFAIQLADVLTKMHFTPRERSMGNKFVVTANRLQYMSVTSKVQMAKQLGDRGILMIDEIRQLFNYAPLPQNAGQHAPIRGEYYMVDEGKDGKNAETGQQIVQTNADNGGG